MESDGRLPTGEWNGFYIERHQPKRGWMHLYLSFENGELKGEGTDYVGPWVAQGKYDLERKICHWEKQYIGRHSVAYSGQITENGIQGEWSIRFIKGPFHIWPRSLSHLNELYLTNEINEPFPQISLQPLSELLNS